MTESDSWSEFERPHSSPVEYTTTEEVAGLQRCRGWWEKGGTCKKVGIVAAKVADIWCGKPEKKDIYSGNSNDKPAVPVVRLKGC